MTLKPPRFTMHPAVISARSLHEYFGIHQHPKAAFVIFFLSTKKVSAESRYALKFQGVGHVWPKFVWAGIQNKEHSRSVVMAVTQTSVPQDQQYSSFQTISNNIYCIR